MAKTDEMTQAVGVDEAGGLWAIAGGGSTSGGLKFREALSIEEGSVSIDVPRNGAKRLFLIVMATPTATSSLAVYLNNLTYNPIVKMEKGFNTDYARYAQIDIHFTDGFFALAYYGTNGSMNIAPIYVANPMGPGSSGTVEKVRIVVGTADVTITSGTVYIYEEV